MSLVRIDLSANLQRAATTAPKTSFAPLSRPSAQFAQFTRVSFSTDECVPKRLKKCFSLFLYRKRNAIERMLCRLKGFRRIATRYDRNASKFLATVCIVATVSYWL